jgi:hypothetical protein
LIFFVVLDQSWMRVSKQMRILPEIKLFRSHLSILLDHAILYHHPRRLPPQDESKRTSVAPCG